MNPFAWVWGAVTGLSPASPTATSSLVDAEQVGDDQRPGRSGQQPGQPPTKNIWVGTRHLPGAQSKATAVRLVAFVVTNPGTARATEATTPSYTVFARMMASGQPDRLGNVADSTGFKPACANRAIHGIRMTSSDRAQVLGQKVYVPIFSRASLEPVGVLRLASSLNSKDIDHFQTQTGLDASLFFGAEAVATTLHDLDDAPLLGTGLDPAIYQEVVGHGRALLTWRDLAIGRQRVSVIPLARPDGARVGMISASKP